MRKRTGEELRAEAEERLRSAGGGSAPVYGLLDGIRSLHNVGSVFRTADAVRARKLFLCGMTGRPPRREISKTALGAEETVPWEYVADPRKAAALLREMGVSVVALEQTRASVALASYAFSFPACLAVGHEVDGVSDGLLAAADAAVEIPMAGRKTSLNVAVAFGIAAYEMTRQWHARQPS